VISDFKVSDEEVYVAWVPSSSEDVVYHQVLRKTGENDWEEITRVTTETEFTDTDVQKKSTYLYAIEAVDESGLPSGKSNIIRAEVYDTKIREDVGNITAIPEPDERKITLQWEYNPQIACSFQIYRSYNDTGFRIIKTLSPGNYTFSDKLLVGEGGYRYAVRAVHADGGKSPLSAIAEVTYPSN
jgi:fibronectin type 3 domain-containing protein